MDLTKLTDAELSTHLNAVLAEQERRAAIANAPAQIEALTTKYTLGGGDVAVVTAAVNRGKRPK